MAKQVTAAQIQQELDETAKTLPIFEQLPRLFFNKKMFDSVDRFEDAGFKIIPHAPHKMMVGSHKEAPRYLFKKYNNDHDGSEQLLNYMRRIEGARMLRSFIEQRRFTTVVAPRKWLYELPSAFPERYLVVIEKMDLLSKDATDRSYKRIGKEQMRELAVILYYFRGLNSTTANLPFTEDGKIAFIDTERWANNKDFLRHVGMRLRASRRDLAKALYDDLKRNREQRYRSAFK